MRNPVALISDVITTEVVPPNSEIETLKAIARAPARTIVGNRDGRVEGIVALKQMRLSAMISRPRNTMTALWHGMSHRDGNVSSMREFDPARATSYRPAVTESLPMSGMSARQQAMTRICRI